MNSDVIQLLLYLLSVAEKTEGADVWRALFAELLARAHGEPWRLAPAVVVKTETAEED